MDAIDAKNLEGRLDQEVTVFYLNGRPYTGLVCERLQDRLDVVYQVVDGEKNGVEIEFYPNGHIQSIRHYAKNVLEGLLIRFYENGNLEEKALFNQGVYVRSLNTKENKRRSTMSQVLNLERLKSPWIREVQEELSYSLV